MQMINAVGSIEFDGTHIDVYESFDVPLFKLIDIVNAIDIPEEKILDVIKLCEGDEIMMSPQALTDNDFSHVYVTESGLYNILAQSHEVVARKWRRVIIKELIDLRKSREMDIVEQFDEWDHMLDDLYFDEDTGVLMTSMLIQGGDVIQVPYGAEGYGDENGRI